MKTPAQRSAEIVGAISIVRDAHAPAEDYARSIATPGHALDLDSVHSEPAEYSTISKDSASLAATSPVDLSDRILRALFGTWPPKDCPHGLA